MRIPEVEKAFVQVASDIHCILVIDDIDQFTDPPSFCISSHDLHGSLPEIVIGDTGDRWPVLNKIERETAKLCAITRTRKDFAVIFPGCKFLLPTKTSEGSLVGLRFAGWTN